MPKFTKNYQDFCRTKCLLFNRCSSNIINVILVLIKIDLFIQNSYVFFRSSRPEVFCKKGVLRNFARFTGKHLWHGYFWFLSNMTSWRLWWQAVIRKNFFFLKKLLKALSIFVLFNLYFYAESSLITWVVKTTYFSIT